MLTVAWLHISNILQSIFELGYWPFSIYIRTDETFDNWGQFSPYKTSLYVGTRVSYLEHVFGTHRDFKKNYVSVIFLHESLHIKVEEIVENFLRKNLQYLKWSPSGKESTPRHLNSFCWRSRINYTLKVYVFKSLIVSKVDWQYISSTKIFSDDLNDFY